MITSCFFIPVCLKDKERVLWAIKSIQKNCFDFRIYVLIDSDSSNFYELHTVGKNIEIIYTQKPSNGHWGRIWQLQNEGMIKALQCTDLSPNCIFVKMDSDAMVIRHGLVERAQKIFAEHPECGQLGQCHFNISGKPLENKGWANYFEKKIFFNGLLKAFLLFLKEGTGLKEAIRSTFRLKHLLKSALENGYKPGEFALGGAYILRVDAVRKLKKDNWLADSPFRWLAKPQEDVVMTPHIYAIGYKAFDDVGNNGIFAICGKELWIHPLELCQRGHYILHPIKYGVTRHKLYMSEFQLTDFLLKINPQID